MGNKTPTASGGDLAKDISTPLLPERSDANSQVIASNSAPAAEEPEGTLVENQRRRATQDLLGALATVSERLGRLDDPSGLLMPSINKSMQDTVQDAKNILQRSSGGGKAKDFLIEMHELGTRYHTFSIESYQEMLNVDLKTQEMMKKSEDMLQNLYTLVEQTLRETDEMIQQLDRSKTLAEIESALSTIMESASTVDDTHAKFERILNDSLKNLEGAGDEVQERLNLWRYLKSKIKELLASVGIGAVVAGATVGGLVGSSILGGVGALVIAGVAFPPALAVIGAIVGVGLVCAVGAVAIMGIQWQTHNSKLLALFQGRINALRDIQEYAAKIKLSRLVAALEKIDGVINEDDDGESECDEDQSSATKADKVIDMLQDMHPLVLTLRKVPPPNTGERTVFLHDRANIRPFVGVKLMRNASLDFLRSKAREHLKVSRQTPIRMEIISPPVDGDSFISRQEDVTSLPHNAIVRIFVAPNDDDHHHALDYKGPQQIEIRRSEPLQIQNGDKGSDYDDSSMRSTSTATLFSFEDIGSNPRRGK